MRSMIKYAYHRVHMTRRKSGKIILKDGDEKSVEFFKLEERKK